MDKFYKFLSVFVILITIFVIFYNFNKTVIKNDFVMTEDEELEQNTLEPEN